MQTDRLLSQASIFLSIGLERFSYYGMRAILVLYFITDYNGGLGLENERAFELYALYGLLIYLVAIPVGVVSDFWTGHKLGIIIGSISAALGMFVIPMGGVLFFLDRDGARLYRYQFYQK